MAAQPPVHPIDPVGSGPANNEASSHHEDASASANATEPLASITKAFHDSVLEDEVNNDGFISIDSNDDADSAVGDMSRPGSTMSARSSVYDYVEENGRTYHRYKEGKYMLPNDAIEQDRLDLQHQLWLMTLEDRLFLAPIKENPQHVLDMGTGTGIWAIDFAIKYPSASVIGNDLSPIQPEFAPPNCSFEIEDIEDEWTYNQKFDLIHGRLMLSCFKDPRTVLSEAFKHLAPGGYLEMQDADFPMRSVDNTLAGTAFWEWNQYMVDGAVNAGRPWTRTKMYKSWMEELGFVDVKEELRRWPINTWPKDPHLKQLGLWFREDLLVGLTSAKAVLTRSLGWGPERADGFLMDVKRDIRNRGIHAYMVLHIVYGKKPE